MSDMMQARVKGQLVELPVKWSNRYKAWHREGTSDLDMIKDCERNYTTVYDWIREQPPQECSVLDLGANVGYFTKLAVEAGAGMVYAVEADETNCRMAAKNVGVTNRAGIAFGAIVREKPESGTVEFFTANSKQSACSGSTIRSSVKRNSFTVPAVVLAELCWAVKPQVIKCDIEGGEYDLFADGVPDCVQVLALETHLSTKWMIEQEAKLVKSLEAEWGEVFRQDNMAFKKLFAVERVFIRK